MIVANLDIHQPIWSDTGGDGAVASSLTETQGNILLLVGLLLVAVVAWLVRRRLAERLGSAMSRPVARVAPALALLWSAATTLQVSRALISTENVAGLWLFVLSIATGLGLALLRTRPGSSCVLVGGATVVPFAVGLAGGVASPNKGVLVVLLDASFVIVPLLLVLAASALVGRLALCASGSLKRNPVGPTATRDLHQTRP
jgi:hypothetical protein